MELTTNNVSKNEYVSNLNPDQISNRKFDDSLDADRVYLVNGNFTIDSDKIAQAVKEGLKNIQLHSPIGIETLHPKDFIGLEGHLNIIEKNVFIPQIEIKTIEVPVIIKEIEIKEVVKQIYIPQIEYKILEIPTIVEKIEYKEINTSNIPNWIKLMLFGQMVVIILSFMVKR